MKVRLKFITIYDAEQYTGELLDRMRPAVEGEIPFPYVFTPEGMLGYVHIGDWIIKDPSDDMRATVMSDENFKKFYEAHLE